MPNPPPNWETIANNQIVGRDWTTIRNVWTAAALRYDPSSASDLSQILDPIVTRGWLLDVMKCVESLGKRDFTLDEIYAFERHLGDLYPGNQNVKPKIRQQLQYLRDRGFIDFVSRGNYRLRS
ncbi:MAG: hypothetical protein P4M05_21455 [Bradyrhizobium sp.]|nr:hypothetical protein [Bradyrhizobium sp.]